MVVREENDVVVARAGCGLSWFETVGDLDRDQFPMLGGLDPYGDAAFNQRQMSVLLKELDRLPDGCQGQWVDEVRALGRTVLQKPHRYLWFIGD
ncbi:hypothetical protein ACIHFE_29930 [Streptomyces sp. NPDC052396]|uniref:hypothetical protein n=1 Tax=Streptomyces sp. NPDC052396 TaxID=3365689 RepID=UPI0037D118FF